LRALWCDIKHGFWIDLVDRLEGEHVPISQ
jgi:hypothetical protein